MCLFNNRWRHSAEVIGAYVIHLVLEGASEGLERFGEGWVGPQSPGTCQGLLSADRYCGWWGKGWWGLKVKQDKSKTRNLSSRSKNKSDYIIKWRLLNAFSRYQRKKGIHVQKTKSCLQETELYIMRNCKLFTWTYQSKLVPLLDLCKTYFQWW